MLVLRNCSSTTDAPSMTPAHTAAKPSAPVSPKRSMTVAKKNGLSEEKLADLRKKVAEYSDY